MRKYDVCVSEYDLNEGVDCFVTIITTEAENSKEAKQKAMKKAEELDIYKPRCTGVTCNKIEKIKI